LNAARGRPEQDGFKALHPGCGGRLHADCPASKIDLGLGGVDENLQHQDLELMDVVMTLTSTLDGHVALVFPSPRVSCGRLPETRLGD